MERQSHNNLDSDEIKVEDIFHGLKNFFRSLGKHCSRFIQIPPKRKKLFWIIVFLTTLAGLVFIIITPTNYEYVRTIRVAGYGFNQPLQDADTIINELQNIIIPELVTQSLKDHTLKNFLLNKWLKSTAFITLKNDNMHITVKSYGQKSNEYLHAQTLMNLLYLLKHHQQNLLSNKKEMLATEIELNQIQAKILNKVYFSQKSIYQAIKNNTSNTLLPSTNSVITDSGFIASQMYGQVALKNLIDEQDQVFKIQNNIMQLKFNLATLRQSHFSSKFSVIPLYSNTIITMLGFFMGALIFASLTVKIIDSFLNVKTDVLIKQN